MGPSLLGHNKAIWDIFFFPTKREVLVNLIASLSELLFIFILAVKMDTTRILQVAKNALSVGMPCFLLSFNFTISLTLVLRENIPGMVGGSFPFLLSMVLSLNYFPVVVHALSELNLLTSDLSQLAISCAILHKTIGWLTVALTSAIIKSDKGVFMKTELSILALFSVTIFVL